MIRMRPYGDFAISMVPGVDGQKCDLYLEMPERSVARTAYVFVDLPRTTVMIREISESYFLRFIYANGCWTLYEESVVP